MRCLIIWVYVYLNQKHPGCKKGAAKNYVKQGLGKKVQMGSQGLCSVTADQNKISIIASQAAKY